MRTIAGSALVIAAAILILTPPRLLGAPKRPHLLVTRPIKRYLGSIVTLAQKGILPVKGIRITGVYHEDENNDYAATRAYIKEEGLSSWVRLHKLTGNISRREVFRRNRFSRSFARLVRDSDGIVFTGGPDLPPHHYGEPTSLLTLVKDPVRHRWELSFLHHLVGGPRNPRQKPLLARRPSYVIFCICLGMQSLNVAGGGSLDQDIPSELYGCKTIQDVRALHADAQHRNYERAFLFDKRLDYGVLHRVRLEKGWPSEIARAGWTPLVVSIHHQCIEKLAPALRVVARSMDGKVIEAVRHRRFKNVMGVQYHPESLEVYDPSDRSFTSAADIPKRTVGKVFAQQPESLAFHKRIWAWVGSRLEQSALAKAYRRRR